MKAQRIAGFVRVSCLVLLPAIAPAQTVVSGTIAGVVRDTTGAVLPGVTVEAASPALIEKVRTVVTDGQGLYRIVDLRPGMYSVTFTLPGFATFRREGIELTTAFTANVNAELKVGALQETVTVSGASPVVDVQNVMQQTVFSRSVLDSLPTGRTIQAYASLIPGAILPAAAQDVGGNRGESPTGIWGIHGTGVNDWKLLHDGMRYHAMQATGGGASRGIFINHASAQEITLQVGGMSAESETGGVQMNVVPKEGGNTFAGYFVTNYTDEDLQNRNLTDRLRARGLTAEVSVKKVYDFNIGLGGPIVKNKLWFFTAHRWWGAQQYVPGNYANKTQGSWFYTPDFSRPAHTNDPNRDNNLRLTWQVSQKNKVNLSYAIQDNWLRFGGLSGDVAPEAGDRRRYQPLYLAQVSWSYPATNQLLFEAGGTAMIFYINQYRQPGVSLDDIAVLELSRNYRYRALATNLVTGAYGRHFSSQSNQRFSVSYVTGSHAFKTGLFLLEGWRYHTTEINGDVGYTFLNGVPTSVTQWAPYGGKRGEESRIMPDLGIYAQDQWTIRQLTLNLGVRFDYFNAFIPEQHLPPSRFVPARDFAPVRNVPNWKDLSPRLGASYDLFGNGKTAFKGYLSRYVAGEASTLAINSNPVVTSVNSATRTWTDLNGNFNPDCDLRSPAPNGECGPLSPATFGQVRITTRYADDIRTGFGNRGYNWQGSASVQHELRPGLALNVGYFRTWYGNFTATDNLAVTPADYDPFCITAPVDARLPGGGEQICGLYDVTPGKFGQFDNLVTQASHFGKQTEVYNGVDVTLNARFGQGGLLSGGLSTGRTVTDNCDVLVDSPQKRFCRVTVPFAGQTQVKFSGAYPLPWDFQASATLQNIPGIPITASYVATNAQIAPSLGRNLAAGARGTALVELIEPNTRREDRITQLDIRLTKIVRVGRTRVQGMFDVYNALNASPILAMNTRYGPAWLRPQLILAGRLFKFGAQLDF